MSWLQNIFTPQQTTSYAVDKPWQGAPPWLQGYGKEVIQPNLFQLSTLRPNPNDPSQSIPESRIPFPSQQTPHHRLDLATQQWNLVNPGAGSLIGGYDPSQAAYSYHPGLNAYQYLAPRIAPRGGLAFAADQAAGNLLAETDMIGMAPGKAWLAESAQYTDPRRVGQLMSPLIDAASRNILQKHADLWDYEARDIRSQATGHGGAMSSRYFDRLGEASRDRTRAKTGEVMEALSKAWAPALGAAQEDLSRFAKAGVGLGDVTARDVASRALAIQQAGAQDLEAREQEQMALDLRHADMISQYRQPFDVAQFGVGLAAGIPQSLQQGGTLRPTTVRQQPSIGGTLLGLGQAGLQAATPWFLGA